MTREGGTVIGSGSNDGGHGTRQESPSLRTFARRGLDRLAARADRIEFANLADDIRNRVSADYSVYVNSNDQRIVVTRKVA